jgi:hypothetical protein
MIATRARQPTRRYGLGAIATPDRAGRIAMTGAEGHELSPSAATERLLASGKGPAAPDNQDGLEAGGARTFAVTFFVDFEAKTKHEESLSLDALADRVRRTTAATK